MTFSTKYDAKKHPKQIIKLMSAGKDLCHFCGENMIARSTFYQWIEDNPDFAEAVKIGKELAEIWWQEAGTTGAVNPQIWSKMMTNKFRYSNDRTIPIEDLDPNATPTEKVKTIQQHVKRGKLTSGEASTLTSMFLTEATINEKTEVLPRLEALERQANELKK